MLTQETLAAYFEQRLDPADLGNVGQQLADDPQAQKQLVEQHSIDFALHVVLGNGAAHERVKNSIFAVLRAMPEEQLKAGIMRAAKAEQETTSLWKRFWLALSRGRTPSDVEAGLLTPFTGSRARLAFSAAAVFIGMALILWFCLPTRPVAQVTIGKFANVIGTPKVRHPDQRTPVFAAASAELQLGDRIETGDADKAEIQFNDGTTLRLNFNTTLEIPSPKAKGQSPKSLPRPTEIRLLLGEVWSKVQKLTNAPHFAVQTPVATASVKGTEFGLKLQKVKNSKLKTQNSKLNAPLLAILTVREGAVQFSNVLGSVEATALTESQATADSAPTQPQRVAALKTFRLNRTGLTVVNLKPMLQDLAEYLVYPMGWAGVTMVSELAGQPAVASPPAQEPKLVRITGVRPGSPAAIAGLQVGDEISAVNGQAVTNASQIRAAIVTGLNQPIALRLQRSTQVLTVTFVPTQRPDAPALPAIPVQVQKELFEATGQLIEAGYQHQIARGLGTEGEIALEQLARRYPDAAAVQHNLAFLYESKDELGQAIRHYQRAIELDPYAAVYHLNLANALRSVGNLERYLEEAEAAVRLAPGWPLTAYSLGDAYSLLERHEDAVKALDSGLQVNPLDARLWGQKAEVLLRARQAEAALPLALKALELDPSIVNAQITLGNIYDDLGRKDEAEAAERKALELEPSNESACINLANLLRKRGLLEEAEALYRKAAELEPNDAEPWHGLGGIFFDRRQAAEAEKWYRKAFELDPDSSRNCVSLGNVLRIIGRLDQGEQLLRKAIELNPENAEAHADLGILYFQRKQLSEAEQSTLKARELDPSLPVERLLAMAYRSQGKLDQEEQALRVWLARNTNDVEACNNLAWNLAEQAIKLDEALTLATRAAELAPTNAGILDTLGWVYYQRGELDHAETWLKKAVDLSGEGPASTDIREHLKKVSEKKANSK